jgi:hypothetical protein
VQIRREWLSESTLSNRTETSFSSVWSWRSSGDRRGLNQTRARCGMQGRRCLRAATGTDTIPCSSRDRCCQSTATASRSCTRWRSTAPLYWWEVSLASAVPEPSALPRFSSLLNSPPPFCRLSLHPPFFVRAHCPLIECDYTPTPPPHTHRDGLRQVHPTTPVPARSRLVCRRPTRGVHTTPPRGCLLSSY